MRWSRLNEIGGQQTSHPRPVPTSLVQFNQHSMDAISTCVQSTREEKLQQVVVTVYNENDGSDCRQGA